MDRGAQWATVYEITVRYDGVARIPTNKVIQLIKL